MTDGSDGREAAEEPTGPRVVARPSRGRAAAWTLVGAAVVLTAGWTLQTTRSSSITVVAAVVLLLAVAPSVLFLLQVVAPRSWTLWADGRRLRGHVMAMPVDLDLDDVQRIRVGRVLGDPALVVEGWAGTRRLLLPVGADGDGVARAVGRVETAADVRGPRG